MSKWTHFRRGDPSAEEAHDVDVDSSIHGEPIPKARNSAPGSAEPGVEDLDTTIHGEVPPTSRRADEVRDPEAFIEDNESVDSRTKVLSQRGEFVVKEDS